MTEPTPVPDAAEALTMEPWEILGHSMALDSEGLRLLRDALDETGLSVASPDASLSPAPPVEAQNPDPGAPERLARLFHEAYTALAPKYGWDARESVPWEEVAENNRALMVATAAQVIASASLSPAPGWRELALLQSAVRKVHADMEGAYSMAWVHGWRSPADADESKRLTPDEQAAWDAALARLSASPAPLPDDEER